MVIVKIFLLQRVQLIIIPMMISFMHQNHNDKVKGIILPSLHLEMHLRKSRLDTTYDYFSQTLKEEVDILGVINKQELEQS